MSGALISNALNAFGINSGDSPTAAVVKEFKANTAVSRGQVVKLTPVAPSSGFGGTLGVDPATANTDNIAGVAVSSASAGGSVEVALYGPVQVLASTTNVAAGTHFSVNASSQITTGTVTAGQRNVGYMLEASGTTAGTPKWAFVNVVSAGT